MTDRKLAMQGLRRWMVPGLIVVVVVCWWWCCWPCWFHQATTVMLVRHADRDGSADALKMPEGTDRAAELVHVARLAGITAIFHSEAERTRRTAQDLAADLGLTPIQVLASDTPGLVNRIHSDHRGERVFVVGHSNTVPDIVQALGGAPMPDIDHDVYDDLFLVTLYPCRWRSPIVVHLKYGALTSP